MLPDVPARSRCRDLCTPQGLPLDVDRGTGLIARPGQRVRWTPSLAPNQHDCCLAAEAALCQGLPSWGQYDPNGKVSAWVRHLLSCSTVRNS